MDGNELKKKEAELRKCFERVLEGLDVGGVVSREEAKRALMYGGLWHHANMLLKAREESGEHDGDGDDEDHDGADGEMPLRASGLKVAR